MEGVWGGGDRGVGDWAIHWGTTGQEIHSVCVLVSNYYWLFSNLCTGRVLFTLQGTSSGDGVFRRNPIHVQ